MTTFLSGETGFIVGLMTGLFVGVVLTRWLWVNGQMTKAKMEAMRAADTDGDRY